MRRRLPTLSEIALGVSIAFSSIAMILSAHTCAKGAQAMATVMPWSEAREFLKTCKPTPSNFRRIQASMREAGRCT